MLHAGPGGATPFASSQVSLDTNVAPSAANSTRVVTIVLALVFITGMAAFAATLVLLIGWFTLKPSGPSVGEDPVQTVVKVRDSGVIEDPDLQAVVARQRQYRQTVADNTVKDPMAEMFGGIGAAPVTVYTTGAGRDEYRQIEIYCDAVGFRDRAPIVGDKAHIAIVPAARCRLIFQGNVPIRTWVTGGDTRTCQLRPTLNCRPGRP